MAANRMVLLLLMCQVHSQAMEWQQTIENFSPLIVVAGILGHPKYQLIQDIFHETQRHSMSANEISITTPRALIMSAGWRAPCLRPVRASITRIHGRIWISSSTVHVRALGTLYSIVPFQSKEQCLVVANVHIIHNTPCNTHSRLVFNLWCEKTCCSSALYQVPILCTVL